MNSPDPWYVLVFEELGERQARRRVLSQHRKAGTDVEAARKVAFDLACSHRPRYPWRVKSRAVFQTGPDSWVVQLEGATTNYHFDVKLARLSAYLSR